MTFSDIAKLLGNAEKAAPVIGDAIGGIVEAFSNHSTAINANTATVDASAASRDANTKALTDNTIAINALTDMLGKFVAAVSK